MVKISIQALISLWVYIKRSILMRWLLHLQSSLASSDESSNGFRAKPGNFKKDAAVIFQCGSARGGGFVEWIGAREFDEYYPLVVIRLIQDVEGSDDGIYEGYPLVRDTTLRYYMVAERFVKAAPKFRDGDYCVCRSSDSRKVEYSGFVKRFDDCVFSYHLYPFDSRDALPTVVLSYLLTKAPPPVTDELSDPTAPITAVMLDRFCDRNKGIQGRRNSCYLDTLLFSLFAFSDVLIDDLLAKEQEGDCEGSFFTALNSLRYQIVYPLRASHFVSDEHVDYLRRLIAKETGKEQFEGQTRDIPECMEALFGQILKWTPGLAIGDFNSPEVVFFESFTTELLNCEGNSPASTKQMLEFSALTMNFCFQKVPKLLLLQLPRDVTQNMEMIPSLQLDLNSLLYRSHKKCFSCQGKATLQFPGLFGSDDGLAACFLCQDCAAQRGLKAEEARQVPEAELGEAEEPESHLELSAVLCIERSHYNCFVRCENRWVFFDSMSDQEELIDHMGGRTKQFNIPVVEQVPDFHKWISGSEEEFKKDRLRSFLNKLGKDSHANRLFSYAYMCLYTVNTATR